MRMLVLRPMLFLTVAMMVVVAVGWSVQAREDDPAQSASPDPTTPGHVLRPGRLSDGRMGATGTAVLFGLPAAALAPVPLVKAPWIRPQGRPLANTRIVFAEPTSRGPPGV